MDDDLATLLDAVAGAFFVAGFLFGGLLLALVQAITNRIRTD